MPPGGSYTGLLTSARTCDGRDRDKAEVLSRSNQAPRPRHCGSGSVDSSRLPHQLSNRSSRSRSSSTMCSISRTLEVMSGASSSASRRRGRCSGPTVGTVYLAYPRPSEGPGHILDPLWASDQADVPLPSPRLRHLAAQGPLSLPGGQTGIPPLPHQRSSDGMPALFVGHFVGTPNYE